MIEYLRATHCHPTAAQIHAALLPSLPALALGTVYRNLEVLVAEGLVVEVATASGAVRYDGQLEPHAHFECERCGTLLDLPACAPAAIGARAAKRHGVRVREVHVRFVGACAPCAGDGAQKLPRAKGAARSDSNQPGRIN